MTTQADQILKTALALDPEERVEIAESLILSLDEERAAAINAAWSNEIKRRLELADKGQVPRIPAEQVMREMRERLNG